MAWATVPPLGDLEGFLVVAEGFVQMRLPECFDNLSAWLVTMCRKLGSVYVYAYMYVCTYMCVCYVCMYVCMCTQELHLRMPLHE